MKGALLRGLKFMFALVLLVTASCSGDGDNEAQQLAGIIDMRYKVVVDRSVIAKITYKDPTGAMIVADEEYKSILGFQHDQTVEMPFKAQMDVNFTGTAGVDVYYDLYIYLDGMEARHQQGLVPPNGSASITYDFNPE
ncbi:MAG: hypothetical protein DI539_21695 [Flavobacterium psychrophilum]|nr:MAG: hypothetical protein DI539_21695 [Flavobacterium psychrophilum]